MAALIIFIVSLALVLFYIYRMWLANRKLDNPYLKYFFYAMIVIAFCELNGVIVTSLYLVFQSPGLLFWLDASSRLFFNLTSVLLLQIPLYFLFPKSKSRVSWSYLLFAIIAGFTIYNFTLSYQPVMGTEGIIFWNTPASIVYYSTFVFLLAWIPSSLIFLYQFFQSKFRAFRFLLLGIGFLLITAGVVLQDFVQSNFVFYILYLSMIVGGVTVIFGFVGKKDKKGIKV